MITPRYYQIEACEKLWAFFRDTGADGFGAVEAANPLVLMPTGVGKSVVIAMFVMSALQAYPNQRIMVLTHVKELIGQNADKLELLWPNAPMGVYSDGLGRKEIGAPITFGGVQSVIGKIEAFGRIDLLIIDEAHLVSLTETTRYYQIIDKLRTTNPWLRIIGFSATGYRLGQGKLTDDIKKDGKITKSIFTHVAADYTSRDWFARFIAEGHLVSPIVPRTKTEIDATGIAIQAGEFVASQVEKAVNDEVTYKVLQEAVQLGYGRKCWLAFGNSIRHAELIADMLQSMGVPTVALHSKSTNRDERIRAWKAGEFLCLSNNGIFTTGQDHPPIDFILGLRLTNSTNLHVQMVGRGMRPCAETQKQNCLVADFAGNTKRLGPIDDPCIPRKPGDKSAGEVPVKICEACGCYNHTRATICAVCGATFEFRPNISPKVATTELLSSAAPVIELFDVIKVIYSRHQKTIKDKTGKRTPVGPPVVKASYFCTTNMFTEYVCLEHQGYPKHKALDWWRVRFPSSYEPTSVNDALQYISHVRTPHRIKVWTNRQYPEIVGFDFD